MRFYLNIFLVAGVFVFFANPLQAQNGLRIQRGGFAGTTAQHDTKPLTGGVDYRDTWVDPSEYQERASQYGRAGLTQLPGAVNQMQMRTGIMDNRMPLRSGVPRYDVEKNPFALETTKARLPGDLSDSDLNILKSHDIVIMQDRSSSMGEKEHFPQGKLPRWYWCLMQSTDFARQTVRLPDWSFTLVLFSSQYDVYRNVRLQHVPDIYATRSGIFVGTKLARPLAQQLDEYFQRRASGRARPLIVAVVTDGKPQDDEDLRDVIIDATHRMRNEKDVQIIFLQVGTDDEGQRKLRKLDYKLIKKGARYDIVSVMPFEMVTNLGLPRALITAVQDASYDR